MKNMGKNLAFTLAVGLVLSSAAVFATELMLSDTVVFAAESNGLERSSISGNSVSGNSTGGSSGGGAAATGEQAALAEAGREAAQLESEAAEQGFENAAQMQAARAAGKSAAEYYNNAVVTTAGIENAVPVAQGGELVINGETTNAAASISKVSSAYVDSVRAAREGRLLNVVDVKFPAQEAIVNFYMPGVAVGSDIVAVQYADGAWTDVEVEEVRADHVVLDLKSNGVVAFLEK